MSFLDEVDLASAEATYAVANTPLFLAQKLRGDQAVQALKNRHSAAEVLSAFKALSELSPSTLRDYVKPYVALVALSLYQDTALLKETSKIEIPYADWIDPVRSYLLADRVPTASREIHGLRNDALRGQSSSLRSTTSNATVHWTK